jgi:hypothetical protein
MLPGVTNAVDFKLRQVFITKFQQINACLRNYTERYK